MAGQKEDFLTEVMDTIASLKDSKGSPADKILDRIIYRRRSPLKNASLKVKKALKTGLKSGLIKEVGGKFKLGLGNADYAIFKNFKKLDAGGFPTRQLRRGGRRRGRRRSRRRNRRRGRRRNESFDMDCLDFSGDISKKLLGKSSSIPLRETRRRGRSRKKRRRRRGRRRNDIFNLDVDLESDTSAEPADRSRRRRKSRRGRKRRGRRGRRRSLQDDEESVKSSESKEIERKSSEEKPKTAKPSNEDSKTTHEKREEPQRPRIDENDVSDDHCIHSFHHEEDHYGHMHPDHYGAEYYD